MSGLMYVRHEAKPPPLSEISPLKRRLLPSNAAANCGLHRMCHGAGDMSAWGCRHTAAVQAGRERSVAGQ